MKILTRMIRVYIQNHHIILLHFTTLSKQRYSSLIFPINHHQDCNNKEATAPLLYRGNDIEATKSSNVMYQDSLSPLLYYQDAFAVSSNAHHLKYQNAPQRRLLILFRARINSVTIDQKCTYPY